MRISDWSSDVCSSDLKKMNSDKPEGGQVAEARRQLPVLRAFLVEKDIVSIPGTEQAQVEASPPYNRQNSAYIDIPGQYEKGLPSVYYHQPPDAAWDQRSEERRGGKAVVRTYKS